jgi:multiple sugar transport system substrate-binding protein
VRVDHEGWEDVRPKAAVGRRTSAAGRTSSSRPSRTRTSIPTSWWTCSDVCNYLGNKYGGWYDVCKDYCMEKGKWVAVPMGCAGNAVVHRIGADEGSGLQRVSRRTWPASSSSRRRTRRRASRPASRSGNATGDGNVWTHWLVWSHGGKMVDEKGNVVIASPETEAALNYGKQLYETFHPGTLSWLGPEQQQGVPRRPDRHDHQRHLDLLRREELAGREDQGDGDDIGHANLPVGPVGKTTELNLFFR